LSEGPLSRPSSSDSGLRTASPERLVVRYEVRTSPLRTAWAERFAMEHGTSWMKPAHHGGVQARDRADDDRDRGGDDERQDDRRGGIDLPRGGGHFQD